MIVAADAGDNPLADRREDREAAAAREKKAKVGVPTYCRALIPRLHCVFVERAAPPAHIAAQPSEDECT